MEECNMNNKAEQFNAFLEDQKIKVFQMEELEENEQHTPRSGRTAASDHSNY